MKYAFDNLHTKYVADSELMASKSNIELYFFIIVEKKDNEKMSYTDTVVMEVLECLEKSRVRMINFLSCSDSQVSNRTVLDNSDLYVARKLGIFDITSL